MLLGKIVNINVVNCFGLLKSRIKINLSQGTLGRKNKPINLGILIKSKGIVYTPCLLFLIPQDALPNIGVVIFWQLPHFCAEILSDSEIKNCS